MHLLRSPNPDIILEGPVDHSQKMEGGESGQSHFVDPQSTQEVSKQFTHVMKDI